MGIPFIDLKAQYKRVQDEVKSGIDAVLEHGAYIMGPEIKEIESTLSDFCSVKHAVGCASGTDALTMSLLSLGVKPGDAVFTTPFTFMSTAETVALLGATPVFVDIDPVTYNIDPADLKRKIAQVRDEKKLTPKGVISVDIFGVPADYDRIEPVAKNNGLFLIVDAAQSFGATYKGRSVCSFGDVACTSFFPAKPLGCYGDGGMVFTDDDTLKDLLLSVRVHGQGKDKYDNERLGVTGRLDSMQAAVLKAKFTIFPEEIELRNNVAARYAEELAVVPDLVVPTVPEGCVPVWAQYCVMGRDSEHRAELQAKMQAEGIPSPIYYPIPLHLQTAYASLGYQKGDLPVSEDVASRIFALPMHPYLSHEHQDLVVSTLAKTE